VSRARARASPLQASPRPGCRVCALPAGERDLVNGALLTGWSPRSIASRFNRVNRKDVRNHLSKCVNEQESEEA
jgi:hypothetical protein